MNIYDQQYLLTVHYNLRFLHEKVQTVKAIRQLIGCNLRAAKAIADDYVCVGDEGQLPRRVFRCDGPQLAWALHQLTNVEKRYCIRGSIGEFDVFTLADFSAAPLEDWYDITKVDFGIIT